MKKKLLGLLLILLVAGCIQIDIKSTVEEGVDQAKQKLNVVLGIDEYALGEGDIATVDSKIVRLDIFDADYVIVFDVDGQKIEMRETQDPQVVNGLELTIKGFRYDASDIEGNYITVKIVKYVPGKDEYLFYLDDENQILDHKVKVEDIEKDGTVEVAVDTINYLRVMDGKSGGVSNLYITNVRPNYRAIASERYVILKISEKP